MSNDTGRQVINSFTMLQRAAVVAELGFLCEKEAIFLEAIEKIRAECDFLVNYNKEMNKNGKKEC